MPATLPPPVRADPGRHDAAAQPGRCCPRTRRRSATSTAPTRRPGATSPTSSSAADDGRRPGWAPVHPRPEHPDPGLRADRGRRGDHRLLPAALLRRAGAGRSATPCTRSDTAVTVQMVHQGGMPHGASPGDERADHQPDAARHGPARHRRVRRASTPSPRGSSHGGARRRRRAAPQPRRPARVVPLPADQPARGRLRRLAGEPRPVRRGVPCARSATSSATHDRRHPAEHPRGGARRLRRRRRHRARAVPRVHRPDRLRARRRGQPVGQPQLHPADLLRARRSSPRSPASSSAAISLPVVHTGRITDPDVAERGARGRPGRHRRHGPRPHRRRRPAGQGPRRARPRHPPLRRRQRVHQPPLRRGAALRLRGQPGDQPRGRGPVADRRARRAACSSSAVGPPAWSSPPSRARPAWTSSSGRPSTELGGQLRYVVRAPRHEGYATLPRLAAPAADGRRGDGRAGLARDRGRRAARGRPRRRDRHRRGPAPARHPGRRRRPRARRSATSSRAGSRPAAACSSSPRTTTSRRCRSPTTSPSAATHVTVVYATAPAGAAARSLHHRRHPRPARRRRTSRFAFMEEVVGIDRHTVDDPQRLLGQDADARRVRLRRARLRQRLRLRASTTSCAAGYPTSTSSATPTRRAASSSPPGRPTPWPNRSSRSVLEPA